MKMTSLPILICLAFSSSQAFAHSASLGGAAELALHRMEKLVAQGKIDPSFESKFDRLNITALSHATADDPAFRTHLSQVPGADGSVKSLDIDQNEEGRALRHTVYSGTESTSPPVWPDNSPLTLSEFAMHCVEGEDNPACIGNPTLVPFNTGFTSLAISQELQDGVPIAVIDIVSKDSPQTLRIRFTMAGVLTAKNPIELRTP